MCHECGITTMHAEVQCVRALPYKRNECQQPTYRQCMGNADNSPDFYTRAQVNINSTTYTVHVGEVQTTLRTDAIDVPYELFQ